MSGLTRRELLRLALGAPMLALAPRLLSGCARPPLPDGELLDFGRARAHASLRDQPLTLAQAPASAARRRAKVLVVGAGVAGLAAAWRLRGAGLDDILVSELELTPGGTARAGRSELTAYPWGAHYVVAPFKEDRAMVRLLSELGALDGVDVHGHPLPSETAAVRELEERCFHDGRFAPGLYPAAGETEDERAQRLRFSRRMDELAATIDPVSGRRAFALPVSQGASHDLLGPLDAMTFSAWLDAEGFSSWRLRWLCDYACRDDYGTSLDRCSAWAGILYFVARRRPEQGLEDRPVITWPEGNGRVVSHLAGRVGADRLALGELVVDVAADGRGARALALRADGSAVVYECEHVIVAAPRHVATRIIAPLRERPPAWVEAFRQASTAPWVVANVHLSGRPRSVGVAHAWDTVFVGSASVGYVDAPHQLGRDHGPSVWTWYRPLTEEAKDERARLEAIGREGWAEAALSELELGHPDVREHVTRVDIGRLGHGMIRPTPGLRAHLSAAMEAPHARVQVAHTDLSGVALCEEAVDQGLRAAEAVLAALGPAQESWR